MYACLICTGGVGLVFVLATLVGISAHNSRICLSAFKMLHGWAIQHASLMICRHAFIALGSICVHITAYVMCIYIYTHMYAHSIFVIYTSIYIYLSIQTYIYMYASGCAIQSEGEKERERERERER